MVKISKILSGVAGEYFAAAELSRRGMIAAITLRNTKGVDVIASNEQATRSALIQVKTNQTSYREWILGKKAESLVGENLFYVFVSLNEIGQMPTFHVVPSKMVAKSCREGHAEWLSYPKRDGTPRKDTDMRAFRDFDGQYLDNWAVLGL